MNTEQIQRIKDNQKFLLKLLHLHIGNYYPLRRWLGIDYTGKIDEISHLSYGYNTEYFKKGGKWYKKQTRVYQQPDLGYKLNWILDSIPEVIIPKSGQPSWGLIQMRLARCSEKVYQPSNHDTHISSDYPDTNYGTSTTLDLKYDPGTRYSYGLLHFDISDISPNVIFSNATLSLYGFTKPSTCYLYRLTQTNWTENGATWNKYDGTNNWTTPGGDYTTQNGASVNTGNMNGVLVQWYNIQALIQDCFDNDSQQVHLTIRPYYAYGYVEYVTFYSREYVGDTSLKPKLSVTYIDIMTTQSGVSLFTNLRPAGETETQASLACSTILEPYRWIKEHIHTQEWVKEPTHDQKYKS